jgi:hypothetical protein
MARWGNGGVAPQFFGFDFGVDATPHYYLALALVALLIFVGARARARTSSARRGAAENPSVRSAYLGEHSIVEGS